MVASAAVTKTTVPIERGAEREREGDRKWDT